MAQAISSEGRQVSEIRRIVAGLLHKLREARWIRVLLLDVARVEVGTEGEEGRGPKGAGEL